MNKCLICDAGMLHEHIGHQQAEYKGEYGSLPLHYSVCDACGTEQTSDVQARQNKRAMLAFRKQVEGLLTGVEFRSIRERLGLTQAAAARVFGGGPVAFSKYESDDVVQSTAMDKLLRIADEMPVVIHKLSAGRGRGWQLLTVPMFQHRESRFVAHRRMFWARTTSSVLSDDSYTPQRVCTKPNTNDAVIAS